MEGEGKTPEKKKVMVAIDESEFSHYALQWTLDNLRDSIADSHLVIFTALPLADFGYIYASSLGNTFELMNDIYPLDLERQENKRDDEIRAPELIQSVQENQRRLAAGLLEKAKQMCAGRGISAETISEPGDPKEIICDTAEKLHIRLLVLGSHSRGALQRAFLGSVSNYCVHNAKCPVLVVKKQA